MRANQAGYSLPATLFDQAAMMAADGESEEIVEMEAMKKPVNKMK